MFTNIKKLKANVYIRVFDIFYIYSTNNIPKKCVSIHIYKTSRYFVFEGRLCESMCLSICRTFRTSPDQQSAPTDDGTGNRKCYELWERVVWRTVSRRGQSRWGNVLRGGIEWPRNGSFGHLRFVDQEPTTSITQLCISSRFHVSPKGLLFKWAALLLINEYIYIYICM